MTIFSAVENATSPGSTGPEQLLTPQSLAAGTRIVLGQSDGRNFRNELIAASVSGDQLHLRSTGELNNFPALAADRGDPLNFAMSDKSISTAFRESLTLANVGVSVAVLVNIAQEDYLVLVRRPNGMLMLPSGYVNSGPQRAISRHAVEVSEGLRELNEEVLKVTMQGPAAPVEAGLKTLLAPAHLKVLRELSIGSAAVAALETPEVIRMDLGKPFQPGNDPGVFHLRYREENPSVIRPSNDLSVLPGINVRQPVIVDGEPVTMGKFYYLRETRSGQFVFPYRMDLGDISNASLFHTETAPAKGGKPGELHEILDQKGLILAKTSPVGGILTGETFYLLDGALVPTGFSKDSLVFSEVFSTDRMKIEGTPVEIPTTTPRRAADGKINTTVSFADYVRCAHANLIS